MVIDDNECKKIFLIYFPLLIIKPIKYYSDSFLKFSIEVKFSQIFKTQ